MRAAAVLVACALQAAEATRFAVQAGEDGRLSDEERVRAGECVAAGDASVDLQGFSELAKAVRAELFDIKYGKTFKVVSNKGARTQYVLTQCGFEAPSEAQINDVSPLPEEWLPRKHFSVPVMTASSESTVNLAYLAKLGVQDRVRHAADYSVDACWQKVAECSKNNNGPDAAFDVVFRDCPWNEKKQAIDCSLLAEERYHNVVTLPVHEEKNPIHDADYFLFVAAFFNKEVDAMEIIEKTRAAWSKLESEALENPPLVAWVRRDMMSHDWEMSTHHCEYRKALARAAGARVMDGQGKEQKWRDVSGSDLEKELRDLGIGLGSGVVVDESMVFMPKGGEQYVLPNELQGGIRVLRHDATLGVTGGLDWLESRFASPHVLLKDFKDALRGRDEPGPFFREVSKGSTQGLRWLEAKDCKTSLPICDATVKVSPIPLRMPKSKSIWPMVFMSALVLTLVVGVALYCWRGRARSESEAERSD